MMNLPEYYGLTGLPETTGNGWRMDVRVLDADGHAFSGVSARVYVYDAQAAELRPGDMFTARIRLNSTLHTSAGRSLAARGCFLRGTAQNVCRTAEHTRPVSTMPLRLRRLFLSRADALFRDGAPMMRFPPLFPTQASRMFSPSPGCICPFSWAQPSIWRTAGSGSAA